MPDTTPDEPQTTDPLVAALLRERAGYVHRDLPDRVAAVDAELKRLGHKPPKAAPASSAPPAPPKGRQAPRKSAT